MAKQVVTTTEYTDDLTGGKADGTVSFSLNGAAYEIDLSKANTRALEKALKPYLEAGRKVRASRGRATRRSAASAATHDVAAVRDWAKQNGYEVSDRGRIAGSVIDAYHAANA